MYEERFSFSGSPFRLAPDPKFFYGSKSHNKAMSYLHYGLRQAEGFIVITGEIGAGKTMLIGHLLDQLDRTNVVAANLLTPNLEAADLLSHVLSAFRIEAAGEGKASEIEAFEDFLFDQLNHGRRVLLVVDEAQNLPLKTLEELRVLSNMEYDGTPLFQVFLVGQPDFRETMARSDMEQLRQRVIATYHLEPMSREETEGYIKHRLTQVGWTGVPALTCEAFDAIYGATGGLPRKIHKLCNRVFLYAAVEDVAAIDGKTVEAVLADLVAEQAAGAPVEAAEEFRLAPAPPVEVAAERAPPPVFATPPVEMKGEAPMPTPPTPIEAAPVAPPPAPVGASVFDRLKSERSRTARTRPRDAEDASAPKSATLDEVATAIAAARVLQREQQAETIAARAAAEVTPADGAPLLRPRLYGTEAVDAGPVTEIDGDDDVNGENGEANGHPAFAEDPSGWKSAVVATINDTREEMRRAHQSVARLRRQLTEIDSRRRRRREQIDASLGRAETLLAEIRNAWR